MPRRADWTEAARANLIEALKAQQAARGGKVHIAEHRGDIPSVDAETVAQLERLNYVVDESIVLHKYLGVYLPTKRRKGLEYTLGEDAVSFGRKTGFDYMLFLRCEGGVSHNAAEAVEPYDVGMSVKALVAFEAGHWGQRYAAIAISWRRNWQHVVPFFAFPEAVRRIIYTTDEMDKQSLPVA